MTERLSAETFHPAVGTAFGVDIAAGRVELTLADVQTREQDVPDAPDGWRPFTLVFRGPREPFVPQATYAFAHDTVGRHDIFVVPIAQDATSTTYEAVFG